MGVFFLKPFWLPALPPNLDLNLPGKIEWPCSFGEARGDELTANLCIYRFITAPKARRGCGGVYSFSCLLYLKSGDIPAL